MKDAILHASPDEVRHIQNRNFAATLDHVFAGSAFYRARFRELGIERRDIRGLEDIARLPLTTKDMFVNAPGEFVLDIPEGPVETRMPWETLYTTGSSGRPTPFQSNAYDFYNILTSYRRMLEMRGVGSDDVLGNLYPLTQYPQGAYIRVMNAASALHIPVVALLPGRPSPHFREGLPQDDIPAVLARTGVTALWGTPSFVRSLLRRAHDQKVQLPRLRHLLLSGEPLSADLRADILYRAQLLGAEADIKASYGATEMQAGFVECRSGSGFHDVAPEEFFFEVLNPTTRSPVPDGEEGLLAMTHLNRRGTVLLRYTIGDLVVMTHEPCLHCGATVARIVSQPRRVDDRLKIKGMLVDTRELMNSVDGLLADREFRFRITRQDIADPLSMETVLLETTGDLDHSLAQTLTQRVKTFCGITPQIHFVAYSDIVDPSRAWKLKRIIDER